MNKKRALIIRLSALGDVIFTIPLANVLKDNGYEVTWITSEKGIDIVKNNPAVDEAILVPLKKWGKQSFFQNLKEYLSIIKYLRAKRFDVSIDSQGLIKSGIWNLFCGAKRRLVSRSAREFSFLGGNEIIEKLSPDFETHVVKNYLKFAKYLNLKIGSIKAELPPSSDENIKKIDLLLQDVNSEKPLLVVAPATTWVPKHWNKEKWKELLKKLEDDFSIVFTGMPNDNELIEYISEGKHLNLAGKTNVLELAELFRRADLVLSLDSGSTHLAWASAHPKIVSIFCCTPKTLYAPIGDESKYIALSGNIECQPCHLRRCPLKNDKNLCTLKPSVEEVYDAIYKLLPKEDC